MLEILHSSTMRFLLLPFTALTLHFTSCAPNTGPAMNESGQINTVRASNKLMQQGLQQFESMKKKKRISTNSTYNAQMQRVATRLKRTINMPGARWEFIVFEDPTPNAFALPGGKVGVHTGLFPITKTDGGLAAVLGHEISHVTRNHAGSRRTQATGLALGGLIIDQIAKRGGSSSADRTKLGAAYGAGATIGLALPHSRKAELEADRIGTIYMAKAGYNPTEAVAMWQRFADYNRKKGSGSSPEFLRTHPLDTTRINALRSFLPTAMREYNRP